MSTTSDDTSILSRLLTFLWDHTIAHAYYVLNFGKNHESLESEMDELRSLRDDVKRRIDVDEANSQMSRRSVVDGWLRRVDTVEKEVELILEQGSQQIEDWWTIYQVGREMSKKLVIVMELCKKGNFESVAEKAAPRSVQKMPEIPTEGMETIFDKVWRLLGDDDMKILGIFGVGGVGKTTLMLKINNSFLVGPNQFHMVILVHVSSEFTVSNVQKQIGERLGLLWLDDEEPDKNKQHISNALEKKNFLLLLDDLWQDIDLGAIGIPSVHSTDNNSKVVFTTRSESVCGQMNADEKLRVPTLDRTHAWSLFYKKVGLEALDSDQDIQNMAKEVVKICDGLPLALITVSSGMTSKKTIHEWEHARMTLRNYAHEFVGMEKKVFSTLMFSYDNLENDTVKHCFLYCSLYPKERNISRHDLVRSWIAEGYLDKYQDMGNAINKGIDIIGILKSACLLESDDISEEEVRMQNIVRELAIWIARKKRYKWFVDECVDVTRPLGVQAWESVERLSITSSCLYALPRAPECSRLLTLMLKRSPTLSTIASGFFRYMPILRVLDLSHTGIKEVPESIGCLLQLQSLDLSYTKIQNLPDGLGNLTNLRFLNLRFTLSLKIIPCEKISCLTRFHTLDLFASGISLTSADLERLEHVKELGVNINEMKTLNNLSNILRSSVRYLGLVRCEGLSELELGSSQWYGVGLIIMKKLQQLMIMGCLEMKQLKIGCATAEEKMSLLSSLEVLRLHSLPKLNITWNKTATHLHFEKLCYVDISYCDLLKDITWVLLAPKLTSLHITGCPEVERVLLDAFPFVQKQSPFSNLKALQLIDLPKLECISEFSLLFPCLVSIVVANCSLLRKLPFTSDSTNKPSLRIEGSSQWWNGLQWQDEATKSSFQPFFVES